MEVKARDILAGILIIGCFILKSQGIDSTVDNILMVVVSSYYTYEFATSKLVQEKLKGK